ncbi:MAG: phytoene/squalene synthase family protein [Thermoguttaceae bacterium]|nr:phytoene/squalene synthase family protein [Thermoguttaceae bacterium]
MSQLRDSYELCAKICAGSGSSFTSAFRQLAPRERRAMEAVYAFMRAADDLVDAGGPSDCRDDLPLSREVRAQNLDSFREDFLAAEQGSSEVSIFLAVWDVIRTFSIPRVFFLEVLRGIQMDLERDFYETAEDLEAYCYHVASAVGLICLYIWGVPAEEIQPEADSEVFRAAVACGKALQWTNILRDVLEDATNGRLYLPLADWPDAETAVSMTSPDAESAASLTPDPAAKFQRIKEQILNGEVSAFRPVIEKNLAVAHEFYVQARALRPWIPAQNRRIFDLITGVYFELWKKIHRHPMRVFHKITRLSGLEKLKVWFRTFFR